jgi:hypothetical protein
MRKRRSMPKKHRKYETRHDIGCEEPRGPCEEILSFAEVIQGAYRVKDREIVKCLKLLARDWFKK